MCCFLLHSKFRLKQSSRSIDPTTFQRIISCSVRPKYTMETVGGTAASVGNNYTDAPLSCFSAGADSPFNIPWRGFVCTALLSASPTANQTYTWSVILKLRIRFEGALWQELPTAQSLGNDNVDGGYPQLSFSPS